MKILFDQNIPRPLRRYLAGHLVFTARSLAWDQIVNGELIALAEARGFDILITADKGIFYQQNNQARKLALIVLESPDWTRVELAHQRILETVESSTPGKFTFVSL